jgi:hypothetical protein
VLAATNCLSSDYLEERFLQCPMPAKRERDPFDLIKRQGENCFEREEQSLLA